MMSHEKKIGPKVGDEEMPCLVIRWSFNSKSSLFQLKGRGERLNGNHYVSEQLSDTTVSKHELLFSIAVT